MNNILNQNNIKPKYVSYILNYDVLKFIVLNTIKEDTGIELNGESLVIACDEDTGKILMYIDDMEVIENEVVQDVYEFYEVNPQEDYVFGEVIINRITNSMNSFAYSLADYNCSYSDTFPCEEFEIYVPIEDYMQNIALNK